MKKYAMKPIILNFSTGSLPVEIGLLRMRVTPAESADPFFARVSRNLVVCLPQALDMKYTIQD